MKRSSSAMSRLASKVLKMKLAEFGHMSMIDYNNLLADAKALSGSVLSQDEVKGQDDA